MPASRNAYPTPALEKGLDILELFAREPAGLTKSEVARRLDRSVSEIFRMLVCLEDRGYIARDPEDDRFRLTLRLCHLGVLNDANVVITAVAESPISPGFSVKLGSVVDLMQTASGHVILSYLPPDARARAIEQWQAQTGGRPPRDLETHLRAIRTKGFEEHESYVIRGVTNLSFPVLDERRVAVAAMTVPYLARMEESVPLKTARVVLKEASDRLSRELGCT